MNLHRHRHFFIDVEAFGPPGQGHPFALACVPFTLRGDIGEGKQWNFQGPSIKHGVWESAERSTLRWLLSQPEAVRSQVNGDMPFELAYAQFRDMVQAEPGPVMLWSDDWSDFAWIDSYVRLWTNENVPRDRAAWSQAVSAAKDIDPVRPHAGGSKTGAQTVRAPDLLPHEGEDRRWVSLRVKACGCAAIADEHALAGHVCHVPIMCAPDNARAHRPKSHVSELLGKRYARPPARYLLKIADQHRRCEAGPVEDDADDSEGRGSASRYRERRGDVLEPAQHFCRAAQGKLVPEGNVEARHEDSPGAV